MYNNYGAILIVLELENTENKVDFNMIKRNKILVTAFAAALATSANQVIAEEMEKCRVVNKDGYGLIKEGHGECAAKAIKVGQDNFEAFSCAGNNPKNHPDAWIMVPKGQCEKINTGDFSGVSDKIKDKIEMNNDDKK